MKNQAKLEKQKKLLVEAGVMEETDSLVDYLQANYVERLIGKVGTWKQGWAYFTEERLIVLTGVLDNNIIIPYRNIKEIGKCSQGLFPMGIVITYEDGKTGEIVSDKVSMTKRDKWIQFMEEKAEI